MGENEETETRHTQDKKFIVYKEGTKDGGMALFAHGSILSSSWKP